MCGINVIYNQDGILDQHKEIVHKMNKEMLYRGPNAQVVWSNEHVVFGHNRLSIIGIEDGAQPLFNKDKSIALICNGEIYNYLELKEELVLKGHNFETSSDCEVMLYLYEELGLDFIYKLRGMFAFCLWDSKSKELIVARDRMGKKPLYFARSNKGVVLSSEIKSITKHFLSSFTINPLEVTNALKYSHPLEIEQTIVNEVAKVKPGEYIIFKGDSTQKKQYWSIDQINRETSHLSHVHEKTYDILKESVDIRLRSDVPVAILLSSGIDSCSVAALAKKSRDEVHAITVGYKENGSNDERKTARKFAKEKGLIYHEIELDQKDFKNYFEEYTSVIDEPVCDVAAIAQWGIYKKAKELGFKVLLSGIGGDELFYGYGAHNQFGESWNASLQLKQFFPLNSWKGYVAIIKYLKNNRILLNGYSKTNLEHHFTRYYKENFLKFKSLLPNDTSFLLEDKELDFYNYSKNGIDNVYQYLLNEWLINNCFYQTDKLAMGNSIEVRAPFADNVLIEYVMKIPFEQLYYKGNPKGYLKQMMQNDLPDYILNMPKKGFTPPSDYIKEIVTSYNSKFYKSTVFDFNQVVTDRLLSNYLEK